MENVKQRIALGKPIGSFQHSRFALAEMATETHSGIDPNMAAGSVLEVRVRARPDDLQPRGLCRRA